MQQQTETDIDSIPDERIRGADLGLEKFITLDNSASEEYLRFLRQSEEKIKRIQVHFSRKKKGSRRRRKLAMKLSSASSSCEKAKRRLPEQTCLDTAEQRHGCTGTREAFVEEYAAKPLPLKVDRRCCVWQFARRCLTRERCSQSKSSLWTHGVLHNSATTVSNGFQRIFQIEFINAQSAESNYRETRTRLN